MKKLKYIFQFIAIVTIVFATSCKKESEGISKITYYADFKMAGQPVVYITDGTPFTDPGVTATENGASLPVTTTIAGDYFSYTGTTVDVTSNNRYLITYTATNKDGFPGSVSREVYVVKTGDMVTSLEGIYSSTVVRNGVVSAQYANMEYVMIRKTGANTYELSDGIGGYYDIGRKYGAGYRAQPATFTANDIPTSNFTFGPSFGVGSFGGVANIMSMTVDATAKTITFQTDWDAGPYTFIVTLTQVNL